jgi:predicted AlkP superfamily phosphohydrolase/phosphomutase
VKLIIAGFDALDSKLFAKTTLPNLKQIRELSQWGTLNSDEMRTGPCWTSILTGLSIENHGVTHLLGLPFDGSNWFGGRLPDYIFDFLSQKYTVGVVNFPSLYISREVHGWMIGGWPGQPNIWPYTFKLPLDLYSDLPDYEKRALNYLRPQGAQEDWSIHEYPWSDYIKFARKNARMRLDYISSLPSVDVLMIQDSVMDRAGHMLSTPNKGKKGANDKRYLEALDLADWMIGELIKTYKPDYFSIVSDHGFDGSGIVNHSKDGVWSLYGKDIVPCRNNTDQVNYTPTILDALGIEIERDGKSVLMKDDVERQLKGLGYI